MDFEKFDAPVNLDLLRLVTLEVFNLDTVVFFYFPNDSILIIIILAIEPKPWWGDLEKFYSLLKQV